MHIHPWVLSGAMSLSGLAAHAAILDGKAPLECSVARGHDCLPGMEHCGRLTAETGQTPVFAIDFLKREIRSPYRTAIMRASQTTENPESLILQGADLLFAWSALINKTTGALTVSIADRKGAYVVFGQCELAKAP